MSDVSHREPVRVVSSLVRERDSLQRVNEELEATVSQLRAELHKGAERAEELNRECIRLTNTLSGVRNARDNQAKTIRDKQDTIADLTRRLEIEEKKTKELSDILNKERVHHSESMATYKRRLGELSDELAEFRASESVDSMARRLVSGYVPESVNEAIARVDDRTVTNALIALATWISDSDLKHSESLSHHRDDIREFCEKIRGRIYTVEERLDQ